MRNPAADAAKWGRIVITASKGASPKRKLRIRIIAEDKYGELEIGRFRSLGTAYGIAEHLCQTVYPVVRVEELRNRRWKTRRTMERRPVLKKQINHTLVTYLVGG